MLINSYNLNADKNIIIYIFDIYQIKYLFRIVLLRVLDGCLSTFNTRVGCPSDSLSLTLTSAVVASITNRFFGSVHKDEKYTILYYMYISNKKLQ